MALFKILDDHLEEFLALPPGGINFEIIYCRKPYYVYRVLPWSMMPSEYTKFVEKFSQYIVHSMTVRVETDRRPAVLAYAELHDLYAYPIANLWDATTYQLIGFKTEQDVLMFELARPDKVGTPL
jgi:hypothetical protein